MTPHPTDTSDYLQEVSEIVKALENIGVEPVLIGGMALVILGSQRVTQDFDFVIARPDAHIKKLIDIFYDKGLQLASRLDKQGKIVDTIDNRKIAEIRLRLDSPSSAYFLNHKNGLRIDLLFDFPILAKELVAEAKKRKIRSHSICIASESHLIRLKKLAKSARSKPGDAEDLAFLESLGRKK